jgi:hypothetical protein
MKDIPSGATGKPRVPDESYTEFKVAKIYDLKGDFWVVHTKFIAQ